MIQTKANVPRHIEAGGERRPLRKLLRMLKHEAKTRVGLQVTLFRLYILGVYPEAKPSLAKPETDLVMEGFGGSANSYAFFAFTSRNPDCDIAHHLHAPAQVLLGARMKKPTILLIRNPADAVASLVSRGYHPSIRQCFRHYSLFYRRLLPVLDRVVVAEFGDVTTDFPRIIDRVNERFSTDYVAAIDNDVMATLIGEKDSPTLRAAPVPERLALKRLARQQVLSRAHQEMRKQAQQIYHSVLKRA